MHVPPYVFSFLSKGSKFVPDLRRSHVKDVLHELHHLRRSLQLRAHFDRHSVHRPRVFTRCRLPNRWEPPPDPQVDALVANLRRDIIAEYSPCNHVRNFSFWDFRAIRWLRENRHLVCVADCDKGLGDGLFDRAWVHFESL